MPRPANQPYASAKASPLGRLRIALAILLFALLLVSPWLGSAQSQPQPQPQLQSQPQPSPVSLTLPVKCDVGASCLVQKLFDHDLTTGRQDYRCGLLTTDGHDGVDIRLRTMVDMRAGYAVVASAAGQIIRVRDGEPDISSRQRAVPNGRDAGNGVVIDHGNGWQTQYSHLRQGSIGVKPGQRVMAGDALGLVGMSGDAEFPHLHFTVRHQNKAIDPFVGVRPFDTCSATKPTSGLWDRAAANALGYVPTALITAGLSSVVPPKSVAERQTPPTLSGPNAPLLMWVDMIGARPGDAQEFVITGPDGRNVHSQQTIVEGGGLSWFAFSGKRSPANGWAKGRYVGNYTLRRDGVVVARTEISGLVR